MPSTKSKPKPKLKFDAIGTVWEIDLPELPGGQNLAELDGAIRARIAQFDRHYSRFRADSLVSDMAARAGTYQLPADARPLLDLYRSLYSTTGGAVTPLVGQVLSDAGYDAGYSLRPGPLTPAPAWSDVLDYDFPRLTLARPVLLDFGAAGKGYLVDIVGELLEARGITAYCVDAGGDLRYRSPDAEPFDIGLEHPADPRQAVGVAHLGGGSLCGSAGNRRAWGQFHHIIDPARLTSPRHIRAVWATAASTLLADGLTTALFFTPPATLARHYDFEYAIIYADYSLEHSPGFPATFFTT